MAYKLRHPFSGAIYTALDGQQVRVEKGAAVGVFDRTGIWLFGDLQTADPEMCRWVGTHVQAVSSRHAQGFIRSHAATPAPSPRKSS